MADENSQITYNSSLARLEEVLRKVKRPGDYFCAGTHETPMPSLSVEGVGSMSFPVPSAQARDLIALAAERAPYGRGDQTLVDECVRKVWQVSPGKVSLEGKGWKRFFQELIDKVAMGLGCSEGEVAAEFYKMLIYDQGGHFAPHRDTEKTSGMFGTLVVALPSAHRGGDLIIRHGERETTCHLLGEEPGEVRYAAFYADCEHEVQAVTEGYRICLVYNLVFKARGKRPMAPDNQPATAEAAKILRRWAASGREPLKLVYLLEHQYTQAALSLSGLKNADSARSQVLQEAAAQAGCALHLGLVHIEESGWAEYSQNPGRRYYDDEEDEAEDEFEIGEVCDGFYYIDQWRNRDDEPVAFGKIPLDDEEILPAGALDGEKPDESHFSEATGNEGASFERTYLRTALVLWPEERFDEICISGGLDAAIARLGQLVANAKAADARASAAAREQIYRFTRLMPQEWPEHEDHGTRLAALLQHLASFGEAELIAASGKRFPLGRFYDFRQNKVLIACARILGSQGSEKLFGALFEEAAAREPAACLDLWSGLAGHFRKEPRILDSLLNALIAEAPKAKKAQPRSSYQTRHHWDDLSEVPAFEETNEVRSFALTPELLTKFLATASRAVGADRCRKFLDALRPNPQFYAPETLLVPCLEHIEAKGAAIEPAVRLQLWQQCAGYYLLRSAAPPAKPRDWAQPAETIESGKNPLLRELAAFARDPQAREYRFRVRKELRQELHRAIQVAGLDMTHITERMGSPQTLVCTKTRATYERTRRKYEGDLDGMRRLLALLPTRQPEAAATAKNLREALAREQPA